MGKLDEDEDFDLPTDEEEESTDEDEGEAEEDEESSEDGDEEDSEGDESEHDEDGEEGDGEEEDEEPRVLGRGEKRIRALRERTKELEAKALKEEQQKSDLQRQLDAIQKQANHSAEANREAWLQTLTPEQRVVEEARHTKEQLQYQLKMLEFNQQDNADKNSFEAKAIINPIYKQFAPEVEELLAKARREQGMWFPREEVLKNIIGGRVLANKLKSTTKAKAAKSVAKHKVKNPSRNGSDVGTRRNSGSTTEARNKRLETMRF